MHEHSSDKSKKQVSHKAQTQNFYIKILMVQKNTKENSIHQGCKSLESVQQTQLHPHSKPRHVNCEKIYFQWFSPRMVAISCSMNAQGVVLPITRHFIPLGQYTSEEAADCFLMLSLEHAKQNLCRGAEGHWTNLVSSSVL